MKGTMRHTRGKLRYFLNGKEVSRAVYNRTMRAVKEAHHILPAKKYGHWPMKSEAMGVHPKQIELARKLDKDRGAPPTSYTSDGRPILTSERHKREYCKAHRVHDRNAYF